MSSRAAIAVAWLSLCLGACDQPAMTDQPKMEAYEHSDYFGDGQAARPPVPGTVARSDRLSPSSMPLTVTRELLARGRERFDIYCTPCHGQSGHADGTIVQRGFPKPPTLHSERLRNSPPAYFYRIIAEGYGVMYDYADRVPEDDRWAIAAYIKALQLSQHARLDEVPGARSQLPDEGASP